MGSFTRIHQAKAIRTKGALARLREMGLSKPEISMLQVEIAGGKSKGGKAKGGKTKGRNAQAETDEAGAE